MIKVVLMDIDNTLLDFNLSAEESIKLSFEKRGLPFSEKVIQTFLTVNDGLWQQIEKKEITRATLHDIRFNLILKELGIDFDGHIIEKDFLEGLFNCAVKVPYASEIVKYLSEKYKIYSASNAIYLQQINRLKISGLLPYFSGIFVSEKMGVNKPSKEFFDKCFEELYPIKKDEVIMIGDSISADIEGGKNYGIKTCYFTRGKDIPTGIGADYCVKGLEDIKQIL